MISEQLRQLVLTNELQLGNQLNQAVHQAKSSTFSLLLNMLSEDVRDQAQFTLTDQLAEEAAVESPDLRAKFDLGPEAPMTASTGCEAHATRLNALAQQGNMAAIQLNNCLTPEALVFESTPNQVPNEVLNNVSLRCKLQHLTPASAHEPKQAESPLNAAAADMLSVLDQLSSRPAPSMAQYA